MPTISWFFTIVSHVGSMFIGCSMIMGMVDKEYSDEVTRNTIDVFEIGIILIFIRIIITLIT